MLTQEEVAKALPAPLRSAATQSFVDTINNISSDPEMAEHIRNNFISYSGILKDGKYKTTDYLNAVAYVSYKLMGYTNTEAYNRTFPQRHQQHVANNISAKDVSAYVSAYHKGKLVNAIMEQSLIPIHVLNQDVVQKAINVQVELMTTAVSEKVRSDAANSLLTHLAKPNDNKLNLKLDIVENSGMAELRDSIMQLAEKQQQMIEAGASAKVIIATPLAKQEVVDV